MKGFKWDKLTKGVVVRESERDQSQRELVVGGFKIGLVMRATDC